MTNNADRSDRQRFWENHVAQFSATSLSQAEYCRRNIIRRGGTIHMVAATIRAVKNANALFMYLSFRDLPLEGLIRLDIRAEKCGIPSTHCMAEPAYTHRPDCRASWDP
jgi:hypothetical protein